MTRLNERRNRRLHADGCARVRGEASYCSEVELAVLDGNGMGVDRLDQFREGVDLRLIDNSKAALRIWPSLPKCGIELQGQRAESQECEPRLRVMAQHNTLHIFQVLDHKRTGWRAHLAASDLTVGEVGLQLFNDDVGFGFDVGQRRRDERRVTQIARCSLRRLCTRGLDNLWCRLELIHRPSPLKGLT